MEKHEFAAIIKKQREDLKLSKAELARKIGDTRQSIHSIESGNRNIEFERMNVILKALELDMYIVPTAIKKAL